MDEKATKSAFELSQKAVHYDQGKKYEEAIFCYTEAGNQLLKLVQEKRCLPIFRKNVMECINRAEFLKENIDNLQRQYPPSNDDISHNVEFLMIKASVLQNYGNKLEESRSLYENVVEQCLGVSRNSNLSQETLKKLRQTAESALKCIEELVTLKNKVTEVELLLPEVPVDDLSKLVFNDHKTPSPSTSQPFNSPTHQVVPPSPSNSQKFTKEELDVLSATSNINNKLYVPFHSYDKVGEFKGQNGKFTDPDGKIGLTQKQRLKLKGWKRVSELFENPTIISSIDCHTIRQTVISDCSFISSLSIAALYEKRFKKQLVTSIIHPQDANGKPIYNPAGKYMIKFHINGVWRKVVIDDYFPVDENNRMMCSQTENKGELWVSLLEKAYMKVMGGYDFPGSNSNIDLNALTGWIPERIELNESSKANPDAIFRKLFDRFHRGDCLITLATGKMSEEMQKRSGLVETHAYAVIDIRSVENNRLLKVKNPWTHSRWKGNFSDKDKLNWTAKMKNALSFDPEVAAGKDDGIFWIDYESVRHFFDVIYVNWKLELFPFTSVYHATWKQEMGPIRDVYTVGDNPQYTLTVNVGQKTTAAAVWILLTRHITAIDDFAVNKEFITLIVYETGQKIYIPTNPRPISDGVRINSPLYLCQLLNTKPGVTTYTLVVAQYEKTNTINYSLRVFSTTDVKLEPIMLPYSISKTIRGNWDGSEKHPIMKLVLHSKSDDIALFMELKAPKQFCIALEMKQYLSDRTVFLETKSSGAYRPGYTVLTLEKVPAGTYYIKASTYTAGDKGPFILRIDSSCKFELETIKI
ncbi:CRE-CLP-2 protein [Caenorhabditis remanei]|uniref:CRE-CLP-2 protein n=1 Tax=Caenorhabditis remanei TaxID=31234 RepID=E3MCU2_CAERE|nr:CRE-CLP-2 protein [Caenorhabditis remanei]